MTKQRISEFLRNLSLHLQVFPTACFCFDILCMRGNSVDITKHDNQPKGDKKKETEVVTLI